MNAAQKTGKGKCCQVYPKHNRNSGAHDARSSSPGAKQVSARAKDRNRRKLKRTTSWRYHPRPRGLVRPQPERYISAAAVPSAAAAMPPPWLRSNYGADLLLLAAGVRGGSSSVVGCSTTRRRSLSDSTAVALSSASSSSRSIASLAREARRQQCGRQKDQEQEHHETNHFPREEEPQGRGQDLSVSDQSFGTQDTEEGTGEEQAMGEGEGWQNSSSRSANILREAQPAVASPTAVTTVTSEKRGVQQLFPSWLRVRLRRLTRPREEDSPKTDSLHPPVIALPQPPSAAVAATARGSTAARSFRSAVRSCFRRRRRPSKPSRETVAGKTVVAAALACGAIFQPEQGE